MSPTWTPATPAQYPFPSSLGVPLDSVHDTLVIHSDGTYQEQGGVWGTTVGGAYDAPLDVQGVYVVHSSGFTLIPINDTPVDSSTATVDGDTLTMVRYPGTWKFSRF